MAINEKWDRAEVQLNLWGTAKPWAKKDYSWNEINSIWKPKAKKCTEMDLLSLEA